MDINQKHLNFISRIYDVVLDPTQWQPVLDEFFPFIGCKGANLIVNDVNMKEISLQTTGSSYEPEMLMEFAERFGQSEMKAVAALMRRPAHTWLCDKEAFGLPSEENPSSLFLKKHGHFKRNGTRLNDSRAWIDAIVVSYGVDRDDMTPEENATSQVFLPHFAKAIEATRPFLVLKYRFNAVLEALDRFHTGVFILTPTGSLIVANKEANRIAGEKDGLAISPDGKLRCVLDTDREALGQAIDKASSTALGKGRGNGTQLAIQRRSGEMPYLVQVAPLSDSAKQTGEIIRGALVYVNDPERTVNISTNGLQQLFTLTNAEIETYRLLTQGFTSDEIADIRNISPDTVRGTFKQLFKKTDCRNQADLVRLALTVNLPIDEA